MVEVVGDRILVDGKVIGSLHEYINNTRRVEL